MLLRNTFSPRTLNLSMSSPYNVDELAYGVTDDDLKIDSGHFRIDPVHTMCTTDVRKTGGMIRERAYIDLDRLICRQSMVN